ncbi:hypothetical protein DL766_006537 [Monosporascus sp. MC13-8B]|uniref:Uncharacterized protein n=1 Tax=Monosporascus cannonballus TaxID=155416 RepID=A0ABY0GUP4_9PEZI|nr:hypothetical protein DL763_011012 [Monosporascus cannonballus]RYO77631.1 hypothetical protein DL762_009134 [Monosporascus cannonballus]RYP26999.1 hypothetical protein DL766_006537 [Monosporascus sp. MC13-8B]
MTAIHQQPKDTGDDPRKSRTATVDIAGPNALKAPKMRDTQTRYAGPGGPAHGDHGGCTRSVIGGQPDGSAEGGANVVAEARRHEGVSASRGKEDHLPTRSTASRTEVYGEKRVPADNTSKDADDLFLSPIIFPVTKTFLSPGDKDLGVVAALEAQAWCEPIRTQLRGA